MISDIILTTSDLPQAEGFYDAFFALFGAKKANKCKKSITWQADPAGVALILKARNENLPSAKGGDTAIALKADSAFDVSLIYKTALRLGAHCEGKPHLNELGEFTALFSDADENSFVIYHKI